MLLQPVMKCTLTLTSAYADQNKMKLRGTDLDNEKY